MGQEFLDKIERELEAMNLKVRAPTVEKGLLDLPVNLMHEVFGPLDARSLLETAKSHRILRKQVKDWPGKRWQIVERSGGTTIIDCEDFEPRDAIVLLENAVYKLDNDGSKVIETTANICDLPYQLLWRIMEPLNEKELLTVANCHRNLVRATKHIKDKRFGLVRIDPGGVYFSDYAAHFCYHNYSPGGNEALLTGASVASLSYNLKADITPDMRVQSLWIHGGRHNAHKCAGLIEKWKPSKVAFPKWDVEAFFWDPDLARVLKEFRRLEFEALPVELLEHIPDWKFTELKFRLCSGGQNLTSQIQALGQKLYDQWYSFQRDAFVIFVELESKLGRLQIGGRRMQSAVSELATRSDDAELKFSCRRRHFSMASSVSISSPYDDEH